MERRVCVSDNTYTGCACLRVLVPMRVSVQSNMRVGKNRGVHCVHVAVPTCHVDAVCLCVRGSISERGRGMSACRSRSMISVRVSNTHLHR